MSEQEKAGQPVERKPWHFKPGDDNPRRYAPDRSGRQPGTKNRSTLLKEAILDTFDDVGGRAYLKRLANSRKDRHLFVGLLAKSMPTEVTGKDGGPIDVSIFHVATEGLARLSDERLKIFYDILQEIGVNDVILPSANDEAGTPLLAAPPAEEKTA